MIIDLTNFLSSQKKNSLSREITLDLQSSFEIANRNEETTFLSKINEDEFTQKALSIFKQAKNKLNQIKQKIIENYNKGNKQVFVKQIDSKIMFDFETYQRALNCIQKEIQYIDIKNESFYQQNIYQIILLRNFQQFLLKVTKQIQTLLSIKISFFKEKQNKQQKDAINLEQDFQYIFIQSQQEQEQQLQQHDQQLMQESYKKLTQNILNTKQIFIQMQNMIQIQGQLIDWIDLNVKTQNQIVKRSRQNLQNSLEHQQSGLVKWIIKIETYLAILFTFLILIKFM